MSVQGIISLALLLPVWYYLQAMNLRDYLTKHDGKPRPDGPELIRLAAAVGKNTYYLYLTALGHKRVSAATAQAMHEQSIERELDAEAVNKQVET